MSMGMRARMATMQMRKKKHRKPTMDQLRRKKHCQPTMDQRRMWRPEGIVLQSVKIGQYISDL